MKPFINSQEKLKSTLNKRVLFFYGKEKRTGIVKSFYQEGRKVYLKIYSDMTKCITHIDSCEILEFSNEIIQDDKKYSFEII